MHLHKIMFHQAPVKEPFLIFLKNSTSVNPIAVEKFRDLCYNINIMQTEHKMMVIDWNISYAGDAQIKIDFLKSLVSDTYCIILQEVTENSYEYLKKIFCQCTILYSLNYRKPSKFDSKARKLGVTIILSNDITVLKCGIVERNILPERTLFATVKTASKQEIRILGIHSITGCDYKKAKSLQYDCLAEFVSEYKPDIIGIDANEPQVDSYDISQMKFFNNGKGAETFFNEVKDIGLSNAFVLFHDIATKSDIVPLAVSHRINNKIPVRYDFIFVNNSFNVKSFSYDYKNAVNAGSDHAILICNI